MGRGVTLMNSNQTVIYTVDPEPVASASDRDVIAQGVIPDACRVPGAEFVLVGGQYYRVSFTMTVRYKRSFLRAVKEGRG